MDCRKPMLQGSQVVLALLAFAAPVQGAEFLLLDRDDPEHLFEVEPSTAGPGDFDEFLKGLGEFRHDQRTWNEMREATESGRLGEAEAAAVSTAAAAAAPVPQERPPEIEAPAYGTSLTVTGRKVIGFDYSSKRFLAPQTHTTRPRSLSLFDIRQELQIRMQGKVGPKVTVNVDYDDTKTNKQDISVVYQGDPQEVVQNASFGDIDLSLPATEFVSYNKQLFGIRADLKYGRAKATFVGSRTKGTTKTKRFIGNTQLASASILDTSYIRRQYYDLTFDNPARLPLAPASERVFVDLLSPAAENINTVNLVVDDLAVQSSSTSGRFNLLSPGLDYTVDYANGLLTFKNSLPAQAVVAVDFKNADGSFLVNNTSASFTGGTGLLKLAKTSNDLPISTTPAVQAAELGYRRELKTNYAIGQSPIVRDDGRGNFILKVLDLNRTEVGASLSPSQRYPATITVDFENGLFKLQRPFGAAGDPARPDPDVYSPTPQSKRLFNIEYYFRLKTFFLEPNLVLQSETILVDGRTLSRNLDYFIDYDSGFVTFFKEESIGPQSVIDLTYEVAPFGGIGTESLLGGRVSYDVTSKWGVGSTALYQAAGRPPSTPTLRELPKSLLVYDVDTTLKDLRLLPFLRGSFAAEYAQSVQNPNLSRFALVENMEGVKQEDAASMDQNFWHIASNPQLAPADPLALRWRNEVTKVLDIFPKSPSTAQDTQQVLAVDYDFSVNGSSEVSVVYPFSDAGLDFTKKSFLEVVLNGDLSGTKLDFHLGSIDENADGTGAQVLTCSDGTARANSPKTEDANCDAVLQQTEDIGWLYAPPGRNSKRFGQNNGRIDTADLNRNGRLDPQDFSGGSFGYVSNTTFTATNVQSGDKTTGNTVAYAGWHTLTIPLNISTANAVAWSAIRQVRVSLRQGGGVAASSGTLRIARLAAVGNLWQAGEALGSPGTVQVNAVNSQDNPDYVPIFSAGGDAQAVFDDLYGGEQRQVGVRNRVEQALALTFKDLAPQTTALTRRTFTRALDMTQHKELRFLVFGGADRTLPPPADGSEVAFLRLGNESNYFEAAVPLPPGRGWRLVTLKLETVGTSQLPTRIVNASPFAVQVSSVGSPSLQQIAQLVVGVSNRHATNPLSGTVWFNEVHVSQPRLIVGEAKKFQGDFDVPGWMGFGGKFRFVDRNFQTPTSVITNQDNEQVSGYLNFNRLSFLPMSFTANRTITETPSVAVTGDRSNLVSLLNEGKVTKWNGTAKGTLTVGAWPKLSLGYARDRTDYDLLTRLDERRIYSGQMNWSVPGGWRPLPRTVDLGFTRSDSMVSFADPFVRRVPGNYDTEERAQDYSGKLSFNPWQGASLNPGYRFTEVHERRTDSSSGSPVLSSYTKSRGQEAAVNANLKLLSWLNPAVNYTVTTNENSNLNASSRVVQGVPVSFGVAQLKAVTRSASGGVTLPLSAAEIFPDFRPLRSFTLQGSYQLQDGDSWQDVEKQLNSLALLSVRQELKPKSGVAQLLNQTLRDTYNLNARWAPFEAYTFPGRLTAFQTLSLTNNFTTSLERKSVTGTQTKTVSQTLPDLLASLGQMEKLLHTEGWMANGLTNVRLTRRRTETIGQSLSLEQSFGTDFRFLAFKRLDSSLSFNERDSESTDLRTKQVSQATEHRDASGQATFDLGPWRFTPKVDWSTDQARTGGGRLTQDVTVITPSVLVRADLSLPAGLRVPFSSKTIVLPNRIIWTTTTSYARRRSPLTEAENSDLLNMTTSGDYEIAKNLRMTLNGGFSRLWHKFLKQEDFISYNLGTTLTFQF